MTSISAPDRPLPREQIAQVGMSGGQVQRADAGHFL